jgi:glucosamine--fructose-6-phosphate aminotransferase (isomerizing)
VAVVQNGIIENHRALREQLEASGVVFQSETDTEVIPHLLAAELQQLQAEARTPGGGLLLEACSGCCPSCRGPMPWR